MKNKLFISVLCLAIFQTASFANCPLKSLKLGNHVPCQKPANKQIVPPLGKQFELQRKIERAQMYDALNLTQEQKDKAIELDTIAFDNFGKAARRLGKTQLKLDFLQANNACLAKITLQERAVRRAKLNCNKQLIKARKDFEKILNDAQKEKYEKIIQFKREERIRRFVEHQNNFKHFGQMPPEPQNGFKPFGQMPAGQPPVHPMFDTEGGIIPPPPQPQPQHK